MKKLLLFLAGSVLLAQTSFAQTEHDISIPEFRQTLYDFAQMMDQQRGTDFAGQLLNVSDATLAKWYTGVPDGRMFKQAVAGVRAYRQARGGPPSSRLTPNRKSLSGFQTRVASPDNSRFSLNLASPAAGISTVTPPDLSLFTPGYPSGSHWDEVITTVQSVGLLPAGATSDFTATRCDSNLEAYYSVLVSTFQGVKDAAASICEIVPNILVVILGEGTEVPAKEICFGINLILNVFNSDASKLNDYCAFQDGLIDYAQTEASYYNSLALYNQKLRLKIENNLQNTLYPMSMFELPSGMGGFLEVARSIVKDTIDKVTASGYNASAATLTLATGDTYYNAKNYKIAYKTYQKAYLQAIQ